MRRDRTPPEGAGALIRLDRELYGLVSGMSGWSSQSVGEMMQEGYAMNVYVPCCSLARDSFLGGVLLESG